MRCLKNRTACSNNTDGSVGTVASIRLLPRGKSPRSFIIRPHNGNGIVTHVSSRAEGGAKVKGNAVDYIFLAGYDVHVKDPIVDFFVFFFSIEFGDGGGEALVDVSNEELDGVR